MNVLCHVGADSAGGTLVENHVIVAAPLDRARWQQIDVEPVVLNPHGNFMGMSLKAAVGQELEQAPEDVPHCNLGCVAKYDQDVDVRSQSNRRALGVTSGGSHTLQVAMTPLLQRGHHLERSRVRR